MRRIILAILGMVIALSCFATVNMAYAKEETTITNSTFPVQKYLNLGDDKQQQEYFKEGDKASPRSPIANLIVLTIEFATKIMGAIAMIILIISGFVMMFSMGNQSRLDSAKDIFKYAMIGLIVTFCSYTIAIFIQSIFY